MNNVYGTAMTNFKKSCHIAYSHQHCMCRMLHKGALQKATNCSIPVILPDYQSDICLLRWILRRGWQFLIDHRSINKTPPRLSLGQTTTTVVDDVVAQLYGTCAPLLTSVNRSTLLRYPTALTTRLRTMRVSPALKYARVTPVAYIFLDRTMWCTHQGLTSPVHWPESMYLRF